MSTLKQLRNLTAYNLTATVPDFYIAGTLGNAAEMTKTALGSKLFARALQEPAGQSLVSVGWVQPFDRRAQIPTLAEIEHPMLEDQLRLEQEKADFSADLVEVIAGRYLLLCYSVIKRQISSAGIKRKLEQRVAQIERSQLRKVYKKERDSLKDDIIAAVLPTALMVQTSYYVIIDTLSQRIFVASASLKTAEDALSLLREALGSLPVAVLRTRLSPVTVMTDWVKKTQPMPEDTFLLEAAILEEVDGPGKAGVAYIDLDEEGVKALLNEGGRQVTKLAVGLLDQNGEQLCAATIDAKLLMRKVWFSTYAQDQVDERCQAQEGDEDLAAARRAELEASMLIGLDAVNQLADKLIEAFGGQDNAQI